jgi:hypothetical protein
MKITENHRMLLMYILCTISVSSVVLAAIYNPNMLLLWIITILLMIGVMCIPHKD